METTAEENILTRLNQDCRALRILIARAGLVYDNMPTPINIEKAQRLRAILLADYYGAAVDFAVVSVPLAMAHRPYRPKSLDGYVPELPQADPDRDRGQEQMRADLNFLRTHLPLLSPERRQAGEEAISYLELAQVLP